jgi:xylulose-5-phosphate/fructose-6-phosphate phosphoketolase
METALSEKERALIDAYWRAANYLSLGQIYLYDNPLLKQSLTKEHIKPRLLGHWGTTPGLNFIYVHLNRVIKKHDLDMIYITGPGHGGPGLVANAYLEGTYSEVYPNISPDEEGMMTQSAASISCRHRRCPTHRPPSSFSIPVSLRR